MTAVAPGDIMEGARSRITWFLGEEQATWLLGHSLRRCSEVTYQSSLIDRLVLATRGEFQASDLAKRRIRSSEHPSEATVVPGRVSLIVVVHNASKLELQHIWTGFQLCSWKSRELVVVECYEDEPSPYLQKLEAQNSECLAIRLRTPLPLHTMVTHLVGVVMASGQYVAGCRSNAKTMSQSRKKEPTTDNNELFTRADMLAASF